MMLQYAFFSWPVGWLQTLNTIILSQKLKDEFKLEVGGGSLEIYCIVIFNVDVYFPFFSFVLECLNEAI